MFTVSNSSRRLLVTSLKPGLIICPWSSTISCSFVSKTRRVIALYSGKPCLRSDLCCGCSSTFTSYCLDSDCRPCDLTSEESTHAHAHTHTRTLVSVISDWWPMVYPPVYMSYISSDSYIDWKHTPLSIRSSSPASFIHI